MALGLLLPALSLPAGENKPAEATPFHVRFWADGIEISGSAPDRKTAVQLREVLYRVRDRLLLWDDMVVVERKYPFPNIDALTGLIRELELSTCSGELEITDSAIIVSGLTDSLVTHAAFAARLDDLNTDGRKIRNEICIVAAGDLADLDLARPDAPAPSIPKSLRDLPRPLVLYDETFGPPPPPAENPQPLEMPPILLTAAGTGGMPTSESTPPPAAIFHLEPLSAVEFAPDSFLIRANQVAAVQEAANSINQLSASELPVILTGYPDNDGEHAYNDWIGRQRAREVFELLRGMGVAKTRLSLGSYREGPARRRGTVTVFVPRLEKVTAVPVQQATLAAPE